MADFDVVVIGAGPGGYVAAVRAAQLGLKAAVIERDAPGGVCLNWGCIPTKSLIASADLARQLRRSNEFGIKLDTYTINYNDIKKRKDDVVNILKKGVESLFKSKKIELKKGRGRLVDKGTVEVDSERFEAKDIIIATGSRPAELPSFKFDKERVLSSRDILELDELPKKMLIIGGGVNGCEYAYTFNHLGAEVAIVEILERLLPTIDRELGKNMEMLLKKAGVKVMTKTRLT